MAALPEPEFIELFSRTPKAERYTLISKRRLAVKIRDAREKQCCMYCWMPAPVCICGIVPNVSSAFGSATVPVMVFHPEEFLRRSNTGHIAAMLYDAPLLVEGFPPHDERMRAFGVDWA